MPRLSAEERLRRQLQANRRSSSKDTVIPVIRERLHFPQELLTLVREEGLTDLTIEDIWPEGITMKPTPRRGPLPGHGGHSGLTEDDVLIEIAKHDPDGVSISVLAQPFPKVTPATVRNRVTVLLKGGFVKREGSTKSTKYQVTAKGRKRIKRKATG